MKVASIQPVRLLHDAVLICFEATLIHVAGILLLGVDTERMLRWIVIAAVVMISALVTARFEPLTQGGGRITTATGGLALLTILWATKAHWGGLGLFGGWSELGRLIDPNDGQFFALYVGLAANLWAWGRGARLEDLGHAEVLRLLQRAVIGLTILITALTLLGYGPALLPKADGSGGIAPELVLFLVLGLMSLSLTRIVALEGEGVRSAQWRWLRSTAVSSAAVLMAGLLGLALFAEPAGLVLRTAFLWVIYAALTLLSPVIRVLYMLVEWLLSGLARRSGEGLSPLPLATATAGPEQIAATSTTTGTDTLLTILTLMALLIPLIVLVLLIVFARRGRGARQGSADEERTSIFSWRGLGHDLASLLGGLRRPRNEGGLLAALHRLRGESPALRIRRRYVELLLRGEAAERPRPLSETPREFAPSLGGTLGASGAVSTLTSSYEQARYAPETVDEATVQQAEAAWHDLTRDEQRDQT